MTARSGIPLRPDRDALRRAGIRSIARAAIAVGLADRNLRLDDVLTRWPDDRGAELLTRAAVPPLSTADASALWQTAVALLESLTPASAAAALLRRALPVSFDSDAAVPSAEYRAGALQFRC